MSESPLVLATSLIAILVHGAAQAADFDVVILNGRVTDPETEFDAVRNVGIRDARIVAITEEKLSGKETTDQFALTPNIQYLVDPAQNPTEDSRWIFGLRARLAL